jgi:glycosyltransferase involved in cell wall biosynthesis
MTPSISVIIPNRNGAATLGKCLAAALASRHDNFEVIVVDDGSEDDSVEVIKGFPCRLIRLAQHGGAAKARNTGARHSRGDVLFFTDADCLLQPDSLAIASETLARAGPQSVAGGTYTPLPHDRRFFSIFQSVFIHYCETRNPQRPDYLATHALAIPARIFRQSGGFCEEFLPILEDVEFSHRLRRMGYSLVMNPALQVQHIFDFSLSGSLANAVFKTKYWSLYSIRNGDLLADSGTASRGLKLNAAVYFLGVFLALLFLVTGSVIFLSVLAAASALNLYWNKGLLRAFYDAGGIGFGLGATAYYLLLYPLAVGTGACAGVMKYLGKSAKPGWQH